MTSPAHNATLPFPLSYRGKPYASFKTLWLAVANISHANEVTVAGRLRRRLGDEQVSDALLDDCLLLDADTYRKKYGTRKTYVRTSTGKLDVRELYDGQLAQINLNRPGFTGDL